MFLSFGHEQGTGSWGQCVTQLNIALGKLQAASCLLSPFPTHFPFSFSAFMKYCGNVDCDQD